MNSSNLLMRSLYIPLLTVCFLLLGLQSVSAQTVPPAIMAQVNAELQKRGLTESEARVRLLQKGIDLENIPPAELPNYQTQVIAVLDELQAEKKQSAKTAVPASTPPAANTSITIATGNPTPANVPATEKAAEASSAQPATTKQEAVAEAAQQVVQSAAKKEGSAIYGHSMFTDQSLKVFRTTDGAQAPETYVLGEGDEIRITIFGASQTDIQQKIGTDGSIQPTGVPKIFLKGLSLAQAREVIQERLSSAYTFQSDQLAVTIVTARTVLINVFGEAKVTGGFSISALNSALNALSAAGGPSDMGSVRDIQIIRGSTRKSIDIYAFMNDPSTQFKFDIQNNDIIFVPVIKLLVSIEGAVKRPMSYEMLPTETLTDLIRYAGDVKMDVFPNFVQVQRYINGEQRLLEYNLADVRSGQTKVELMNGDIVRIKSIGKPLDQYVEVEGSVYYPGRYDLSANPNLSNLLNNAQPTLQAKTDLIFIERIRPDETVERFSVNYTQMQDSGLVFLLNPRDRVRVTQLADYRDIAAISVGGHVRTPFSKSFALNDRLTIKQAIEMAGGMKMYAYPIAYVLRVNLFNPKEKTYLRLVLETSDDFVLLPGDQLTIFDKNTFTDSAGISVNGHVRNPFSQTFALTDRITVKQAIELAGGLKIDAYPIAYVLRINLLKPKEKTYLRLELKASNDFVLEPGDQLTIFDKNTFTDSGKISITGQVRSPFEQTFALNDRITVKKAIELAGGLTITVYPVAYIFRRNLFNPPEVKYIRIELAQADSVELQPGDQLNIYDNTTFTNIGEVRVFGAVKKPSGYTYDPSLSIRDILTNAGGFTIGAALNRIEVFRTIFSTTKRPKLELITLTVDSGYQVVSPPNFALQPYDQVIVRLTPEFTMGRTVEITGQVEYPGTYVLQSKQVHLSEIIKMAGGLLNDADPYGSRLFRTYRNRGNITMNVQKAMNHRRSLRSDPVLFEGDVININRQENTVTIRETGTRMAQYSLNLDSSTKNVIYKGSRSAAFYVRNYAGGFQHRVDFRSVTVTLPNDQMLSTKRSFFIFRNYPNVKPGSIISLQMKPPKEKRVEGTKTDWESISAKSTASLTAVLTLYLLINQLTK